jgi:FkbM family methyltransferase
MKIEEKLKYKFLYSNGLNIFKFLYFNFQLLKSIIKPRIIKSNWGMDLIIANIFKNKKDGIYIDVGCHHPLINNNTFLLHNKGWKGINIDLDFNSIDMFDYFRPNDDNRKIAITNKEGYANLYFFHNRAAKNTISRKNSYGAKKLIRIKSNTLNNIIASSKIKISNIDFLSIDVEGNELNVLKGLNLKKYKPKVIAVEFINSKQKEFYNNNIRNIIKSKLYNFLLKNNYKLVNWIQDDLVFINKSITKIR